MLTLAIILFLVGAIFGVVILANLLRGQPSPKPLVYIHGLLVGIALILVVLVVTGATTGGVTGGPVWPMLVLIIAALGGIFLFTLDMGKKTMPRPLLILHPIIAVTGVLWLIYYVLSSTM